MMSDEENLEVIPLTAKLSFASSSKFTRSVSSVIEDSSSSEGLRLAKQAAAALLVYLTGWYYPRYLIAHEDGIEHLLAPFQKTAAGDVILDFLLNEPVVDPPTIPCKCHHSVLDIKSTPQTSVSYVPNLLVDLIHYCSSHADLVDDSLAAVLCCGHGVDDGFFQSPPTMARRARGSLRTANRHWAIGRCHDFAQTLYSTPATQLLRTLWLEQRAVAMHSPSRKVARRQLFVSVGPQQSHQLRHGISSLVSLIQSSGGPRTSMAGAGFVRIASSVGCLCRCEPTRGSLASPVRCGGGLVAGQPLLNGGLSYLVSPRLVVSIGTCRRGSGTPVVAANH
jgi:hypothetical protein